MFNSDIIRRKLKLKTGENSYLKFIYLTPAKLFSNDRRLDVVNLLRFVYLKLFYIIGEMLHELLFALSGYPGNIFVDNGDKIQVHYITFSFFIELISVQTEVVFVDDRLAENTSQMSLK